MSMPVDTPISLPPDEALWRDAQVNLLDNFNEIIKQITTTTYMNVFFVGDRWIDHSIPYEVLDNALTNAKRSSADYVFTIKFEPGRLPSYGRFKEIPLP